MLLVKLPKKRMASGKNIKTVHQFIKKLIMSHVKNIIMGQHIIVITTKIHTAVFQTKCLTNQIMSIINVLVKILQLLKIFIA